jgi:hypothetical protein
MDPAAVCKHKRMHTRQFTWTLIGTHGNEVSGSHLKLWRVETSIDGGTWMEVGHSNPVRKFSLFMSTLVEIVNGGWKGSGFSEIRNCRQFPSLCAPLSFTPRQ